MVSKYFITLIIFLTTFLCSFSKSRERLDLTGNWNYRLTGVPISIPGEGEIFLPGTIDENHKSVYNKESDNTSQLRIEFSFIGNATYTL